MKDVFDLYKLLEGRIDKASNTIEGLLTVEYNEIQYNKTTSMNKNYMFNDVISSKFYNAIGINKASLKDLISQYITITNNFDSLDSNNILLIFIMRYFKQKNEQKYVMMAYEIFLYKLYYPIFNNYFKYGVDETAFEHFRTTLSSKYEITKQENIYKALDEIGRRNYEKYSKFIDGNSAKDLLLLPVNTKTRINQFIKELMRKYKPYTETSKVHINASRDIEDEENGTFNDQMSNNNSVKHEYRNRLFFSISHDDIPEVHRYSILKLFSKTDKHDIDKLYNTIKNKEYLTDSIDAFVNNLNNRYRYTDREFLSYMFEECSRFKNTQFTEEIDGILKHAYSDLEKKQKTEIIEKRKAFVLLMYFFLLKSMSKKSQ